MGKNVGKKLQQYYFYSNYYVYMYRNIVYTIFNHNYVLSHKVYIVLEKESHTNIAYL